MARLSVKPETVHRDWDDVTKFRGNPFAAYSYGADDDEQEYDVIHRVEFAQPAANGAAGSPLDPVTLYLAVKNYGPHPVLLYFDNNLNIGDPLEVTIPVGHWVEYVDLNPTTQPRIRVDNTLYSTPSECEILECGYTIWEEEEPEPDCDAWAVGHIPQDGGGTKHFPEAGVWATVANTLTDPEKEVWLADVAGTATNDYWAVGYKMEEGFPVEGFLAHWDDVDWTEEVTASDPPFYGDWGYEAGFYWAVGGLGQGEIWNWNGAAWTQDLANEQDSRIFRAVHGIDAADTWAVGDYGDPDALIFHHDGISWTPNPNPIECNLYGVWANGSYASGNDVWVCGGSLGWWGASGGTGCVFRRAAGVWIPAVLPPDTPTLRAIWGFSNSNIWAVGDQGTIIHWDGFVWMTWPEPDGLLGNYDYRGVFGCFPWQVWAIGTTGTGDNVIIEWDGVAWSIVHGPNADEMDLLGLKGVSLVL